MVGGAWPFYLVSTPKRVVVGGGFTVYMTQFRGRGGFSPIATLSLFDSGRESYCVTAILLGRRISEVISPDVGVSPNFVVCGTEACPTPVLKEVRNTTH